MTQRISAEKVNVEYKDSVNYGRTSALKVNVEYKDSVNYARVSALKVMVEYSYRKSGPALQVVG